MAPDKKKLHKPAITMAQTDHEKLSRLAESIADQNPETADDLFAELDRARIVADDKLSAEVVRMGTTLRFTTDAGEDRTVTLVYPPDADISAGRISILSRIGTALIGLKVGQSIDWRTRSDRINRLTLEEILPEGTSAGETPASEADA